MIVATEFPLNRHESFRAEISDVTGLLVVSIGRWKVRADGTARRAGPALEFAAHRLDGVAELLANVQRIVEAQGVDADKQRASA
jgi:hypothetical protein